jgi:hypothetical protein
MSTKQNHAGNKQAEVVQIENENVPYIGQGEA